jgi:hypothetical protein
MSTFTPLPSPPPDNTSSTAFSPQLNSNTVIHLTLPIFTKLTHNNYLSWQSQMTPILHGHDLYKYLINNPPPRSTHTWLVVIFLIGVTPYSGCLVHYLFSYLVALANRLLCFFSCSAGESPTATPNYHERSLILF